ncbi:MAG: FAD-dependent oxidoreductase, partial [Deltaproteobacteria bacterium]
MTHAFDVVVVGAGIPGTACAGMLARAGLRVAVVDGRPEELA